MNEKTIDLKKVEYANSPEVLMANYSNSYNLANLITLEGYIMINCKLNAWSNNMTSIIMASAYGHKEGFYHIKKLMEDELKDFLDVHEKMLEEKIKNKKEPH